MTHADSAPTGLRHSRLEIAGANQQRIGIVRTCPQFIMTREAQRQFLVWIVRLADPDAEESGKFFDGFDHQPFAESVKLARDFLDLANSRPVQAARLLGLIGQRMVAQRCD